MNITTLNQVMAVNVSLSLEEAQAALEDPSQLLLELRKALGDSIAPTAIGHLKGRSTRKSAPKAKRGAGRRRGAARASTMTNCPQCGKECNPRGLGVHMARKHKTISAPAAGD